MNFKNFKTKVCALMNFFHIYIYMVKVVAVQILRGMAEAGAVALGLWRTNIGLWAWQKHSQSNWSHRLLHGLLNSSFLFINSFIHYVLKTYLSLYILMHCTHTYLVPHTIVCCYSQLFIYPSPNTLDVPNVHLTLNLIAHTFPLPSWPNWILLTFWLIFQNDLSLLLLFFNVFSPLLLLFALFLCVPCFALECDCDWIADW